LAPLLSSATALRERDRAAALNALERQLLRQRMRADEQGAEDVELATDEARGAAFLAWQRATAHVFAGEGLFMHKGVGIGGRWGGG
jgi:hypothetical protein